MKHTSFCTNYREEMQYAIGFELLYIINETHANERSLMKLFFIQIPNISWHFITASFGIIKGTIHIKTYLRIDILYRSESRAITNEICNPKF